MTNNTELEKLISDIADKAAIGSHTKVDAACNAIMAVFSSPEVLQAAGLVKQGWVREKPKADKDRVFASANWFKDHWEFKVWFISLVMFDEKWYYALCEGDGEEWGDYEDLQCDLYFELPVPTPPVNDKPIPPTQ
jgi:hypothetical protein